MASTSVKDKALRLMRVVASSSCRCPAHSHAFGQGSCSRLGSSTAEEHVEPEYAFEMASSSIRYGEGVTREVGMDFQNMKAKKVCVVTDKQLSKLPPLHQAIEALAKSKVEYDVYDKVRIEPTDTSFKDCIDFAKRGDYDAFLAVGGGSVIDTAKAANLYSCYPDSDFLDFVNAPIGHGKPVDKRLKPLIAVPTTAGTGSETTGVAIFDYEPLKAKTGIANRAIRPLLGIVDPLHTLHMPERVTANSGFDVLCHSIESYTAIPYTKRGPRPTNPNMRPAYQGSNPISDVWALHALRIVHKYMKRAVKDPQDLEARSAMHLASVYAGVGFGNAGVHLCHGMSYPISGLVKSYRAKDYDVEHPLVPHGLSVVLTAPAVFAFTAAACPERHIEVARLLGADTTNTKKEDAGLLLADTLRQFMLSLDVDNGLKALGYSNDHIPELVQGTIPQQRVTKLAPAGTPGEEELAMLFENSMTVY
ncbi:hydroxyacid-oxoacid transhydrogenase, mitochondrial [Exaiptasia diaphana]|uniref:hydroxyacid-oxoacid transhydrogenase n=1 Tax=Exaiptasia diaphana TaxID=2652724 RepID=A0A913XTG6_EXADI|nr:hydroxyacid-oxoacid transhydrogenase, mitochondrial [Exaiptasia diaphana]KXJ20076.1 Hydroxyacid-oxoacid transhydrogenase, mitochondrial [Exaiptasia diaphana]